MAPDLARMRADRSARLHTVMAEHGVGAALLLGTANVQYATGARLMVADAARAALERAAALVTSGDPAPHLFTPFPEGAPPGLRDDHVHPPLDWETETGAASAARRIAELLGGRADGAFALDSAPAATFFALPGVLHEELRDAGPVVAAAKVVKTDDELACIHRAQQLNEQAIRPVEALLRPGLRQTDLTACFLRHVHEGGEAVNVIDPIWQVMAPRAADGPFTVHGDVAFPLVTTDRILRDGDVIWVDTGIEHEGYASDFGRTWVVGRPPRVSAHQGGQFDRWRAVLDAVLDAVRPGATGSDLTRAAIEAADGTRPWLPHFYLIHGVGTESAEMPLIGTDLGEAFDESIVLAPGMVLVLEPVVWDDGHGGYRAEEIVAVTDTGYAMLSDYPYAPYR